jgi:hypothetical protein
MSRASVIIPSPGTPTLLFFRERGREEGEKGRKRGSEDMEEGRRRERERETAN